MTAGEVRLDAHTTKNDAGRVFPFTDGLRALLEAREAERDRLKKAGHLCPFVFFREVAERDGEKNRGESAASRRRGSRRVGRPGCPGRIPHDLRRTAVRTWSAPAFPNGSR